MLQDVKSYLRRCVAMKDLGEAAYIIGIKIYRDRSIRLIGLCQSAYIEKILKRYSMENFKRGTIPMQEKLKLSKSDGASTPAKKRHMSNVPYASANPSELHWTTIKNILKYLRNTKDMFMVYGGVVDWKSTKQSIFETSSTDVEYIAAFEALKEAIWIHKFISGLNVVPTIKEPITMYCDNTRAITIAKDHGVTKGDVRIEQIDTDDNLAGPFTKALAFPKHSELTRKIGLIPGIFDQFQPSQYPVIHQPRQEMSTEMLLAEEKLIKAIRTCLKNNNQPPEEKSIAVLLAEKSILTVMQTLEEKQNDTESMQELLLQLSKYLQLLIDFLLEEFAGELALINPIPPGIAETNFDPKEAIRLIKKLLYDNLSPRPPEELNFENDFKKENSGSTTIHTDISLREYESFDDESDSASEIFNDDLAYIISPSEYEYVYIDDESDLVDLTTDVEEDIWGDSTRKLQISHRGFKAFKIIHNFLNESPMMIYGGDIPIWDVPYLHFYPP
ncbi:hypothetical protein Tco_0281944 [Tanacetum coccineum]